MLTRETNKKTEAILNWNNKENGYTGILMKKFFLVRLCANISLRRDFILLQNSTLLIVHVENFTLPLCSVLRWQEDLRADTSIPSAALHSLVPNANQLGNSPVQLHLFPSDILITGCTSWYIIYSLFCKYNRIFFYNKV